MNQGLLIVHISLVGLAFADYISVHLSFISFISGPRWAVAAKAFTEAKGRLGEHPGS